MNNIKISGSVNTELIEYIEGHIIPRYDDFDKAHRRDHVGMVIAQSLKLAENVEDINLKILIWIWSIVLRLFMMWG